MTRAYINMWSNLKKYMLSTLKCRVSSQRYWSSLFVIVPCVQPVVDYPVRMFGCQCTPKN